MFVVFGTVCSMETHGREAWPTRVVPDGPDSIHLAAKGGVREKACRCRRKQHTVPLPQKQITTFIRKQMEPSKTHSTDCCARIIDAITTEEPFLLLEVDAELARCPNDNVYRNSEDGNLFISLSLIHI